MEHLRVVVIPVPEIGIMGAALDTRILALIRDGASAELDIARSARATLQAALDHPVHPPERHKEATL